ncbi:uncharacterized protein V1516DRAFT_675472 [Lipomyces oligophaga]|uniref:uncharacterized protein n=1 Tax=Lipomyces oligophaga TaxID=45792 RepID=UPI0034CFAFC0
MGLKIAVIGATGFTGRHVVIELLKRGHQVGGISRNPTRVGSHSRYVASPLDILGVSVTEFGQILARFDVVVNAYGCRHQVAAYKLYVEATTQIISAFKYATNKRRRLGQNCYLITIGSAGSLIIPGSEGVRAVDDEEFWTEYIRSLVQSRIQTAFFKELYPDKSDLIEIYRKAYIDAVDEEASQDQLNFMSNFEDQIVNHGHDFIRAVTATYLFYEGNESFDWTLLSPPALYCPGKRTGEYDVRLEDQLPLSTDDNDDSLPGISAWDLALAVADEAERKGMKWIQWTVTGDQSDDSLAPTYPKI